MPSLYRNLTRLTSAALVGLAAGCGDADAPDPAATDASASVAGAEADVGPPLRIDPSPLVSIGGIEGDQPTLFSAANEAASIPGNRLVVGDTNEDQIDEFSIGDGSHVRQWARSGDGPNDVRSVSFVQAVAHDTVVVYDMSLGRFSTFVDGTALATHRISERIIRVAGVESSRFAWLYSDLAIGEYGVEGVVAPTPFWIHRVRLSDGVFVDSIGPLPGRTGYVVWGDPISASFDAPFQPFVEPAARDSLLVVAGHPAGHLSVFVRGTLRRTVPLPVEPRPVDDAFVAEWLEANAPAPSSDLGPADRRMPDGWRAAHQDALELVDFPEFAPLVADAMIGSDHAIWVREFGLPNETRRWWRLTDSWRSLEIPARTDLLDATDSTLVVRRRGDYGVPIVEVLRFGSCAQGAC